MSSGKSVSAGPADPLADLRRALSAADAAALRASCAALGIAPEHAERFTARAGLVLERAQARVPVASATEVALALGVLVTQFTGGPTPKEQGL